MVIDAEAQNATSDKNSYCTHPDCSVKNQHTLCLAISKRSPRLYASGMTAWMRYQILMLHNRHRDNVALGLEVGQPPATNMRKLYWDYELEQAAEIWARQCQKRHDECRNTIRFNVLQNMDVRPIVAKVTEAQLLADAVGAWFSGSRMLPPENIWSFRLSNCSAAGGCNQHWYAAAAWASTWRLGCSQALCTAKKSSCTIFRKKRRMPRDKGGKNETNGDADGHNVTRTPADQLDHVISLESQSPLHRGILDFVGKKEERKDVRILAYTFCNYGPAGNIDGFPIYEAGTTCSNCPPGTQCGDRTHRALCAVAGDPDAVLR